MIPFGLSKEQFCRRYGKFLRENTDLLTESLERLFQREVNDDVICAEVQIFMEEDGADSPDIWIYYSGINNKVDSSDESIFSGKTLQIEFMPENTLELDARYYTDDAFSGLDLMVNTLKTWFAECWWKAGGWRYSVPCELFVHDGFGDGEIILLTHKIKPSRR